MSNYIIPSETKIGHVHLKVSNLEKSLAFYVDVLGYEITTRYGTQAAFISAGGYHHHIGLNTWHSRNTKPSSIYHPGLYHTAILYPTRLDLAIIVKRLIDHKYPIIGTADHGVSEAIYLDDPDKNGLELYWDKPKEVWPIDEQGNLVMYTKPLDMEALLSLINH